MANGAKGKGPGNVGPAVENAKKGTADPSVPVTPYTGAPGGVKVGTVSSSDGGGLVIGVYAQAVEGGVKFWVEVESGTADLRGFFLDIGAPGGPYTRAGHADNNMNGTGYTFDYGVQIGTQGAGKDVFTKATFTLNDLPGMSLAEWLDGATFGIRATSVGMDGSSVKLIGMAEFPEVTVSIAPNGDVLEDAPAVFTVSIDMPIDEDLLVTLSNGDSVTIPAGSTSVEYEDGTQGDDVYIDPSSVSLTITDADPQGPTWATILIDTDPAVVEVTDTIDPVIVKLSATSSTSEDGGSITYTVSLERVSGGDPVITNNDITVTLTGGQVIVIPAGESSADSDPVPVERDDVWVEIDAITNSIESIEEENTGSPGAFESLTFDDTEVSTDVLDDVDTVTVGIYLAEETIEQVDGSASFEIRIDQPLDSPLDVELSTGDTITIPAGETTYLYSVEDPPPGETTVSIESASVTGKTFEELVISPDSATFEEPPPPTENFPTLANAISHITIYFSAAAGSGLESLDTKGGTSSGSQAGADGVFTVKIEWTGSDYNDLDDAWNEIYDRLLELNPTLTGKTVLGVAIKAGTGEDFYALDGNEDADPAPQRNVDGTPVTTLASSSGVDATYTLEGLTSSSGDFFETAGSYALPTSVISPAVALG